MSSHIYTNPDFSKKVRYRKVEEGGTCWVENEVDIYDNPDSIEEEQTDFQPQEGGPQTLNRPPVQNKSFRSAALCLGVLCLLMMVGIITLSTRYILVTLEKNDLEKNLNNLSHRYNQSQHLIKQLQVHSVTKEKELQSRIDNLIKNYSQSQNEVKQLQDKMAGK
ncbi:C-type lectin domain family 12 member B-like, partial [Channa argus]|uniref:C-type lectin domain family 12 member B-like n=1 Tax=Channa argus TaxID=215402 RepID=UPI00352137C4